MLLITVVFSKLNQNFIHFSEPLLNRIGFSENMYPRSVIRLLIFNFVYTEKSTMGPDFFQTNGTEIGYFRQIATVQSE